MSKLKNCPFCGGAAYVQTKHTPMGMWYYACCANEDCAVSPKTQSYNMVEFAVEKWNVRESLTGYIEGYIEIGSCDGCRWLGKRDAKCLFCRRNKHTRDLWETKKDE